MIDWRPGILSPGEASRRVGLAAVGSILFLGFSLGFDTFLSTQNLTTIALNSSSVLLAAIGTTALLVSGNVALSIGSQYALVAVVTAIVVRDTGNPLLGIAAAVGLGLVLGTLNGLLVVWLQISPLIVTLAMLAVYRGLAFVAGDGASVFGFPSSFTSIGRARWLGVPLPVVVAAGAYLVGGWVLIATVSGLRLFAIGGNRQAALAAGIRVDRLVVCTFALNGALVGLVALLATAKLGSGAPNLGVQFELAVLTAVILGGVAFSGGAGHPLGVLAGVATLGILDAGVIFAGLPDWYQQISRGALLLLALISDQVAMTWRRARVDDARSAPPADPNIATQPGASDAGRVQADEGPVALFEAVGLTVRYGGADALERASLRVHRGEVVCLVGDNGAGKSTLVKAIAGLIRPSEGTLAIEGQPVEFSHPSQARRAGIETVHQDLALCPNLGTAHNLVLGLEPRRRLAGLLPMRDDPGAMSSARARLGSMGVKVGDLNRPVAQLSGGERQAVAISRVLRDGVRMVILDEPAAALGVHQTAEVLRLVRAIAAAGRGVLLVSHDVENVFEVADRVVVLQNGRMTFDGPIAGLSRLELLRLMSGRGSGLAV
ncbi:MAG: ATP-binding cassette domain-containing protein [Acidimicrobiia bacterium]|nr:ATP-binding cassette domain-containing protein [Acidimicrobiia bacterium]